MIELFQLESCPSCQIVRTRLSALGLDFQVRNVKKLGTERLALKELSQTLTVPLMRDGSRVLEGSEEIIGYLDKEYGTGKFGEPAYGLTKRLGKGDFQKAQEEVVDAFKQQGFGVLTEIDVQATMKKKLDASMRPYVILGMCNPPLAHQALSEEPAIGLLLPCNVVLAQEESGELVLSAIDPVKMLAIVGREGLESFAQQVRKRIAAALASIPASP